MSWADLQAMSTSGFVAIDVAEDFETTYGDRYAVKRWVRDRVAGQKEISVLVEWEDGAGSVRSQMTSTWFTENGMNDYYYRSF